MRRVLPIVCLLAFFGVAAYLLGPWGAEERANEGPAGARTPPGPVQVLPEPTLSDPGEERAEASQDPAIVADMVELAEQLSDPSASVRDDLLVIVELLRAYRRLLEGLPESEGNREIVACLRGENRMQLIFLAAGHGRVDADGVLLDRFGFPYTFRKIDGGLEVRSSGPDGQPGTEDDVTLPI